MLAFAYGAGTGLLFVMAVWAAASAVIHPSEDSGPFWPALFAVLLFVPGLLLALAAGLALRRTPLYDWVVSRSPLLWAIVAIALLLVLPAFLVESSPDFPGESGDPRFGPVLLAGIELSIALTWLMAREVWLGFATGMLLLVALLAAAAAAA